MEPTFWVYLFYHFQRDVFLSTTLLTMFYRVCHGFTQTNKDDQIKMILFESLLTTFEAFVIFWANWGSSEKWVRPKIQSPNLRLSKSLKRSVRTIKRKSLKRTFFTIHLKDPFTLAIFICVYAWITISRLYQ